MTKTRSTKQALLMSVLALVMCVSMLVGSTMAWFTDSVTSTGNKIQAGTLKLDLELYNTDTKAYESIKTSKAPIFNHDKWEPGYTDVKLLKVENEGTLALKWYAKFVSETELSALADVIDVYVCPSADELQMPADRDLTGYEKVGTVREFVNTIETTTKGTLNGLSSAYLGIALKMQETAGNDYQGLDLGGAFDIMILATQLSFEEDSFDKEYDVKATYLNKDADGAWLINNIDELYYFAADVNGGNTYNGETVKLTADIDLAGYAWNAIGQPGPGGTTDFSTSFRGTFDGQGHTVSNVKVTNEGWAGLFGLAYKATIKNVTVENVTLNSSRMTGGVVGQLYGNIENCHVIDANVTVVPNAVSGGYDNGDKVGGIVGWLGDNGNNHYIIGCTAENVTLKAYRDVGGIAGYIGSSTSVEDCAVDTVFITVDQATNYYGDKAANAGGVIGRTYGTPGTIANNTEVNVTIGTVVAVADQAALEAAIQNGATTVMLGSGNYAIPSAVAGKDITLVGEGDSTVIDFSNTTANVGGANITLESMKFVGKNSNTMNGYGIQHTNGDVVYRNCTFENAYTSEFYGNVAYYECKFIGTYYIATYAVDSAVFEGCVFDRTDSRALLVYSHGDNPVQVTVKDCEFRAGAHGTTWAGDWTAAIEVDTTNISTAGTTVTIENCTYDANYNGIVRDKSTAGKETAVIKVDGVVVNNTTIKTTGYAG